MRFFVTGGSRGIGCAIVSAAVEAGHDVAFTWHQRKDSADEVQLACQRRRPDISCHAYQLDVRSSTEVAEVVEKAVADLGSIDVVVCNAGMSTNKLLVSTEDDEWNQIIDTNLTGAFRVCREVLPEMVANRFGRVILMASIMSDGGTGAGAYSVSKAGLLGLSRSIAKEYGRKGITSNVVSPGPVETTMVATSSGANRKFWERYCPVGPVSATAQQVATAVLYLACPDAGFVNGAVVPINGGLDWLP
jgi:NAD(P)-dependent dehydrogenase (short-subunit alcohol dehydrogenase family)